MLGVQQVKQSSQGALRRAFICPHHSFRGKYVNLPATGGGNPGRRYPFKALDGDEVDVILPLIGCNQGKWCVLGSAAVPDEPIVDRFEEQLLHLRREVVLTTGVLV